MRCSGVCATLGYRHGMSGRPEAARSWVVADLDAVSRTDEAVGE